MCGNASAAPAAHSFHHGNTERTEKTLRVYDALMEIILNLLRRLWQSDQWALRTSRLPPKNRFVLAWPDFVRVLQDEEQGNASGQE